MARQFKAILYRGLQIVVLAFLAYGFAQTLPFDLAMLLAGDYLLYFEIATAAWLAAQVTRLRLALDYARAVARPLLKAAGRRGRRAVRSLRKRLPRRGADDDRPRAALAPA